MIKSFIVITSLPDIIRNTFSCGVVGNSIERGLWNLEIVNLYDFGIGIHKKIDDTIFGGGSGMLIMAEVLSKAIEHVRYHNSNVDFYYMSPRGEKFSQEKAEEFSQSDRNICLICGRFEGVDQRIIDFYDIEEISVGDFVLSNGELAAAIIIDSTARLLKGVIGNSESIVEESFSLSAHNLRLLECDKYTKPRIWNDLEVPEVLLSGNHKKIEEWKRDNSLKNTKRRRSDLLFMMDKDR